MNEVEGLRLRRLNRPQVITDDLHMPQSKGSRWENTSNHNLLNTYCLRTRRQGAGTRGQ